ncbi:14-3-3 protein-1 [Coleophoma crateriformis]|uniref:14-3-3 protein-1 n=1 Tax=Coleophoma crateriformis TaxID=565419 RepID=A0A3D8R7C3_9HELO|nr:14-3-3 protein-1 [Coleophoma crateriformis]
MAQRPELKVKFMRMTPTGVCFYTRRLLGPASTNEDSFESRIDKKHHLLLDFEQHLSVLKAHKDYSTVLLDPNANRPVTVKDDMASSEVDMKFLGQFAKNIEIDHPFLSKRLFTIMGNLVQLSDKVIKARKLRRLDTTRDTPSVDLYCRIIWYAREGLALLEQYVLPMIDKYGELKVLAYKLRASYYHLYVLFHNQPAITVHSANPQVQTPPGLVSPRHLDKGKGVERYGEEQDIYRPGSVQPTHQLEGGPVGGEMPQVTNTANFLVPARDFRPIAMACFREATALSERLLWGSHPLRLSVKVEYAAFLYDCMHDRDGSRQLAKITIAEVYNAQEGMDDDMFEDAAELVGILGRMMKRGTAPAVGSTPESGRTLRPGVPYTPGMDNPI